MKKLYSIVLIVLISFSVLGQSNNGFKYQAIIRDAVGNVYANASVNMELSILQGAAEGPIVFTENHAVVSNNFGLVNLTIGSQNPSGFNLIDWANGPYFIQIVIDGIEFGTSQLLSVPYALHATSSEKSTLAETAENYAETDPLFTASSASSITQNQIDEWTNKLSEFAETDPDFNASIAAGITQTQIENWTNKLDEYLERDPEFAASLAKGITESDTAYWNSKLDDFVEVDPTFMAHPSAGITAEDITKWQALWIWYTTNQQGYLKIASPAGGISAADTTNWNTINYSELVNAPDLANTTTNKTISLNTADNSSSFKVNDNTNSTILKVRADGNIGIREDNPSSALDVDGTVTALQYKGDGSQLANVKPIANFTGGEQNLQLTTNMQSWQVAREVSLTVPARGYIFVIASGYADWESTGWDLVWGAIIASYEGDPNYDYVAYESLRKYMFIETDYNCADSSDQYSTFTTHRGVHVSSGGTYTFKLWAGKYNSSGKTELHDIQMSAMYFPTGSVSVPNPMQLTAKETPETSISKKRITGNLDRNRPFTNIEVSLKKQKEEYEKQAQVKKEEKAKQKELADMVIKQAQKLETMQKEIDSIKSLLKNQKSAKAEKEKIE